MNKLILKSSHIEILKYLAIILMVFDHYATINLDSFDTLKIIGRTVLPLFAFVLVYNYIFNTKNKLLYIKRLFIFALISQPFYYYAFLEFFKGAFILNIFFTLSLGLSLIYIYEEFLSNKNKIEKTISILCLALFTLIISIFLSYKIFGILLIISVYIFLKNTNPYTLLLLILNIYLTNILWHPIFSLFGLIALILIYITIKTGFKIKRMNKWFFYIIYPLHLLILTFI